MTLELASTLLAGGKRAHAEEAGVAGAVAIHILASIAAFVALSLLLIREASVAVGEMLILELFGVLISFVVGVDKFPVVVWVECTFGRVGSVNIDDRSATLIEVHILKSIIRHASGRLLAKVLDGGTLADLVQLLIKHLHHLRVTMLVPLSPNLDTILVRLHSDLHLGRHVDDAMNAKSADICRSTDDAILGAGLFDVLGSDGGGGTGDRKDRGVCYHMGNAGGGEDDVGSAGDLRMVLDDTKLASDLLLPWIEASGAFDGVKHGRGRGCRRPCCGARPNGPSYR